MLMLSRCPEPWFLAFPSALTGLLHLWQEETECKFLVWDGPTWALEGGSREVLAWRRRGQQLWLQGGERALTEMAGPLPGLFYSESGATAPVCAVNPSTGATVARTRLFSQLRGPRQVSSL